MNHTVLIYYLLDTGADVTTMLLKGTEKWHGHFDVLDLHLRKCWQTEF